MEAGENQPHKNVIEEGKKWCSTRLGKGEKLLRITIEMLPKGNAEKAYHLGTAYISNDATGDAVVGNYNVRLSKWGRPNQTWKRGRVTGFNRKTRGPWDLFFLALRNIVGYRHR